MAHGSKKWIRDYTGRWKRSRNDTRVDYYAHLPFRREDPVRYRHRWGQPQRPRPKCPQCREIWKELEPYFAEVRAWEALKARLFVEWCQTFKTQSYSTTTWKKEFYFSDTQQRVVSHWIQVTLYFNDWLSDHPQYRPYPRSWTFHWASFLCPKCERDERADMERWRSPYPGRRKFGNGAEQRTLEHRRNRHRIKQLLKHEREDDILPFRKPWLD